MIPTGAIAYVVAALVALAVLVGAHELGFRRASAAGKANLAAYQAQAEAESAKLRAKAAEVRVEVVTKYQDRVKVIREIAPEVVREIEVIRQSACVLPPEFRVLHDRAAGAGTEASAGADAAPVTPEVVAETVAENYRIARETAEQLKALQEWAATVSQ